MIDDILQYVFKIELYIIKVNLIETNPYWCNKACMFKQGVIHYSWTSKWCIKTLHEKFYHINHSKATEDDFSEGAFIEECTPCARCPSEFCFELIIKQTWLLDSVWIW